MQELWEEILQTIKRNRWRSFMTAFGVFWGLLMLIILVGCGLGMSNGITGGLMNVPSNTVFFGGGNTSMAYKGFGKDRYITIDNKDLEIVRENLGHRTRYMTPLAFAGSKTVNYLERSDSYSIVGTTSNYLNAIPQQLLFGRYINEIDIRENRKVCVIGRQAFETLFPGKQDPTGKVIQVGNIYYTIVGVVQKLTNNINIGSDIDKSILLPISTAQVAYNMVNQVHVLCITLHDQYSTTKWLPRIESWMKEHHYVHPDDKAAFWSMNLSEIFSMFQNLFLGINILIWIVGAGTLLAGIIGISNIMLVTVRERTQEIGIRRALGASPFTILSQIMAESLVLTLAAGIVGLLVGVWILALIDTISSANPSPNQFFASPQIPFSISISALIILVVGGLLAGWMPARRAMKIKAIDALRDE